MAIFDFWLSRNNGASLETYIGNKDRLFFDPLTGGIRLSDGVTPGGLPTPIATATATALGGVKPGTALSVDAEGALSVNTGPMFAVDGSNNLQLLAATETDIGGVKLGPGVTTNLDGQIIIDSEGLDFSFGDFAAVVGTYPEGHPREGDDYALLQSVNVDEDIVIASNGIGSVKVIGEFRVYESNSNVNGALLNEPEFRVTADGQVRVLVSDPTELSGGVQIVGNNTGTQQDPVNQGVMLHITGNDGIEARSYVDGVDAYAGFVGRRLNGTAASPSGVLADQEVTRYAANAYTADQGFESFGIGQLRWYTSENITSTNKGGRAEFWVTPVGQSNSTKIAAFTGDGLVMSADKTVTGNLVGTADTATDLAAASNILAGTITVDPALVNRTSAATQTFTLTGLTTDHKIVVTSGTAIGFGIVIAAAWASAANTLSIEFHNYTGNQDIDLGAKTIQYFAWV
jgi:hypothetical protein